MAVSLDLSAREACHATYLCDRIIFWLWLKQVAMPPAATRGEIVIVVIVCRRLLSTIFAVVVVVHAAIGDEIGLAIARVSYGIGHHR